MSVWIRHHRLHLPLPSPSHNNCPPITSRVTTYPSLPVTAHTSLHVTTHVTSCHYTNVTSCYYTQAPFHVTISQLQLHPKQSQRNHSVWLSGIARACQHTYRCLINKIQWNLSKTATCGPVTIESWLHYRGRLQCIRAIMFIIFGARDAGCFRRVAA